MVVIRVRFYIFILPAHQIYPHHKLIHVKTQYWASGWLLRFLVGKEYEYMNMTVSRLLGISWSNDLIRHNCVY
jgi:hypothetical protein